MKGIIPESHNFDVVGPLARCVSDAAIVLDVITGGMKAYNDSYLAAATTSLANTDGKVLAGARFGIPLSSYQPVPDKGDKSGPLLKTLLDKIDILKSHGAIIIPTTFDSAQEIDAPKGWDW